MDDTHRVLEEVGRLFASTPSTGGGGGGKVFVTALS
jgi:hypothetical protein